MEGLTGNISFDEEGKRRNYSLDVVEMTIYSETVTVRVFNLMTYVLSFSMYVNICCAILQGK